MHRPRPVADHSGRVSQSSSDAKMDVADTGVVAAQAIRK